MSKTVNSTTTSHIWDGTNIAADVTNGTVTKYIRGLQLISSKKGSTESFYNYNGHGDVVQLTNSSGSITKQYGYDAFGNEMNKVYSDTNPFRYCGEYYDKENYSIYLRARYYKPNTGRFITEDPVKDGLNWYAYCGNEPVMLVDPSGLEYVVVSGGDYSDDEVHPGFSYNFIEPAITKIRDMRGVNQEENITWIIANEGWSNDDKLAFSTAVKDLSVTIKYVNNKDQVIDYINTKNGGNRSIDKITKFVVFAHANKENIMLGYNYNDSNYNRALNFSKADISKINSEAFDNPNSWFYSCNTGTGNNSFAKQWNNKVGGFTGAYAGKTDYAYIMYPKDYNRWKDGIIRKDINGKRKIHGFSLTGSYRYPQASSNVRQVTFGG